MRPALVTTFHDTVSFCFNSVLEMTGTSPRDVIYERLEILLPLPQVTRFTGATNGDRGKPTDSELTANGMARATGTVTDGLTGSNNTLQTTTVVHILTDATASQAVAKSCLVNTSTQGSANNVQLAAATFTAITLPVGDMIQITWSILWTWP